MSKKEYKLLEGNNAPDFNIVADDGKKISLKDFKGKNIVLYFYPKDDTPGCTTEARNFSLQKSKFDKLKTVVIGVSKDDTKSHCKFKEKYALEIMLASDLDGKSIEDYEVFAEKSMFGKKYMGIVRSTFLIDQGGKIKKIWRNVSVTGHVDEVLKSI